MYDELCLAVCRKQRYTQFKSTTDSDRYRTDFILDGVPIVNAFIDRPKEMAKLETHLFPGRGEQRKRILVLHGLGGMGKTQLAVEFARRHRKRFSSVFWLDGRSEDTLRQSFAAKATRIPPGQIPESSRRYLDSPKSSVNIAAVIHDVKSWLNAVENNAWLLIFDNVDQDFQRPLADSGAYDVQKYFPGADHGSILITTRLSTLDQLGESLKLDKVSDEQAKAISESRYRKGFEGIFPFIRLLKLGRMKHDANKKLL